MVPLRLVPPVQKIGAGEILLDCAFDGAPRSCVLDTGAGDKILVHDDSMFGRYKPIGNGSNQDDLGARGEVDVIRVGHLTIGGADFGPIDVKRRKQAESGPGAALVGPQAVARRGFALLFKDSSTMVVDGPAPAGPDYPLNASDRDRHLLIKAEIEGDSMSALFDTGAGITEIDRDYVALHPRDFSLVGTMRFAGRPDAEIYELRSLSLGGRRFNGVDVIAADFSFFKRKLKDDDLRLMLGYNVVTRADWYFDLTRRRWSVSNAP